MQSRWKHRLTIGAWHRESPDERNNERTHRTSTMDILTDPNETSLNGKHVAILATDGFEESELRSPREALLNAGAFVDLIAPKAEAIKGWKDGNWSDTEQVDRAVAHVKADDYDALVLPGGTLNADKLRMDKGAVAFVRAFFDQQKPVGAICHGLWILAEADVLDGRKVTSYASIKTDLINAGAEWEDTEVVVDHCLVTSRTPKDLPAFNEKLLEEVREGRHVKQS